MTLSGNITLGAVKETGKSAKLDAANGASQIVFKGTEDLGGGLQANFLLSQRFSPESGNNDGTLNQNPTWQGESTVGLSGSFGAVKIGRALTALRGPIPASDPWGTWTVATTSGLVAGYLTDPKQTDGAGVARTDVITYASPSFGGFSGAVSLGLKNSQAVAGTATQAKNLTSLWLSYAKGLVMVGGGGEQNRTGDKASAILASYKFDAVKVMGGYGQVDTVAVAGRNGKNWNLGLAAPVGAFTAKLGYLNMEAEGTRVKTRKVGIGGEYALSKRTSLYTSYGRTKKDGTAPSTGFDLGMNHFF